MESLQEIERKDVPAAASRGDAAEKNASGKLSYEQRKEQEKILRRMRKAVETVEAVLAASRSTTRVSPPLPTTTRPITPPTTNSRPVTTI